MTKKNNQKPGQLVQDLSNEQWLSIEKEIKKMFGNPAELNALIEYANPPESSVYAVFEDADQFGEVNSNALSSAAHRVITTGPRVRIRNSIH